MGDFDITALILAEHSRFRDAFTALQGAEDPGAAWDELAARLEVHAVAEEELLYPVLAHAAAEGAAEGEDAVREHNEIRHAVSAVADHEPGSESWWAAIHQAQTVNADHMAEEEREFLPDFKESVDDDRREELGMLWLQFHDEHP
ncbi:MAG: uncharacterized protein JWN61_2591, partial [Pseudonocardiales bacterium]|nr:uncharacterized protein [Pseudonocardiales bacterium]